MNGLLSISSFHRLAPKATVYLDATRLPHTAKATQPPNAAPLGAVERPLYQIVLLDRKAEAQDAPGTSADTRQNYRAIGSVWTASPEDVGALLAILCGYYGHGVQQLSWPGEETTDLGARFGEDNRWKPFGLDAVSPTALLEAVNALSEKAGRIGELMDASALSEHLRVGPNPEGKYAAPCGLSGIAGRLVLGSPCFEGGPCTKTKSGRCFLFRGAAKADAPTAVAAVVVPAKPSKAK